VTSTDKLTAGQTRSTTISVTCHVNFHKSQLSASVICILNEQIFSTGWESFWLTKWLASNTRQCNKICW